MTRATTILRDQAALLGAVVKWAATIVPLGILACSAVAAFLWSLDRATTLRFDHPWLLWLLPLAGAGVGWLSTTMGRSVDAGNDLILEETSEPGGGVPLRMATLTGLPFDFLASLGFVAVFAGAANTPKRRGRA